MSRSHHGFTLIEILVVLGIILVLMALLLPALGIFKRRATETQARTLLTAVDSAIISYEQDWRRYPSSLGFIAGDWSTVRDNADMLFLELVSTNLHHRNRPRRGYLKGSLRTEQVAENRIVDPWGNPLIYVAPLVDGTYANPLGAWTGVPYELWSAGQDSGFSTMRTEDGLDADNIPAQMYDPSRKNQRK